MKMLGMLIGSAVFSGVVLMAPVTLAAPTERASANGPVAAASQSRARQPSTAKNSKQGEAARWQEIQSTRRPTRIVALCKAFQRDFPESTHRDEVKALEAGAFRAAMLKRDVGLTGDFFETTKGDAAFNANLLAAARGDADGAYLVARAFADGKSGVPANRNRQKQLLHFAAELGHPGASWEMAQLYNLDGRVGEAAHFETRAISLGYKPPPRLSNRDY
jgi:TPR repeat protein